MLFCLRLLRLFNVFHYLKEMACFSKSRDEQLMFTMKRNFVNCHVGVNFLYKILFRDVKSVVQWFQ